MTRIRQFDLCKSVLSRVLQLWLQWLHTLPLFSAVELATDRRTALEPGLKGAGGGVRTGIIELPILPAGAGGTVSDRSSDRGITKFISSGNSRLRVRLVASSNPVLARHICFMAHLSQIRLSLG